MAVLRLDKLLTEMKKGSRSQVKELIRKGKVSVDGAVVKEPDLKIDPDRQCITLDGQTVSYAAYEYYMLNKPQGVVSATEDKLHKTVISLIDGAVRKDLFPVGRLDIDTEGLLLITNDGQLAHELLSPKKHVNKVYFARVEGKLPKDLEHIFSRGFELLDGTPVLPSKLLIESTYEPSSDHLLKSDFDGPEKTLELPVSDVKLTIHEGKFHQVKRMFETFGCSVIFLKRLSMGSLVLDENLKTGEYRQLTAEERNNLKERPGN